MRDAPPECDPYPPKSIWGSHRVAEKLKERCGFKHKDITIFLGSFCYSMVAHSSTRMLKERFGFQHKDTITINLFRVFQIISLFNGGPFECQNA